MLTKDQNANAFLLQEVKLEMVSIELKLAKSLIVSIFTRFSCDL